MNMARIRTPLLILYVLAIFFMSSRPYAFAPGPDFQMKDKVGHMIEYTILGSLLFSAVGWVAGYRRRFVTFVFLVAIGSSIASLDEMFQSYIPGRRTDVFDWVADSIGVIVGVGIMVLVAARARWGDDPVPEKIS